MTNRVLIKRSSVANSVPSAAALEYGEFALNYADGNLFFKNSSNVVTTLASTQFVNVSGNVTGNYILGNGSQLTGIDTTSTSISNGNSNVAIASASANVTMGINGDANTVMISPGSIFVNGLFASPKTITSNVQMAADSSAMVISPLTIASGYSMSIPTSSTVYVWIPS